MYQIGVDIGGTNIKVGLVNETMELVQTCSVRFPHDGARSVVKTIEEAVDFLLRQQAIARKDETGKDILRERLKQGRSFRS